MAVFGCRRNNTGEEEEAAAPPSSSSSSWCCRSAGWVGHTSSGSACVGAHLVAQAIRRQHFTYPEPIHYPRYPKTLSSAGPYLALIRSNGIKDSGQLFVVVYGVCCYSCSVTRPMRSCTPAIAEQLCCSARRQSMAATETDNDKSRAPGTRNRGGKCHECWCY